jgi:hypothetical protein
VQVSPTPQPPSENLNRIELPLGLENDEDTPSDVPERAIASAVPWLWATAICGMVPLGLGACLSLHGLLRGRGDPDDSFALLLPLPALLIALAAQCLQRRRLFGLVLVAAFLCSLFGVLAFCATLLLLWVSFDGLSRGVPVTGKGLLMTVATTLLFLGFTVISSCAGKKALFVLVDPAVRASFRAQATTSAEEEPREPEDD